MLIVNVHLAQFCPKLHYWTRLQYEERTNGNGNYIWKELGKNLIYHFCPKGIRVLAWTEY